MPASIQVMLPADLWKGILSELQPSELLLYLSWSLEAEVQLGLEAEVQSDLDLLSSLQHHHSHHSNY